MLVEQPDKVDVRESAGEDDVVLIELRVDKADLGKVIGKQGRTARAIRSLLSASALKNNKRVRLEIID